MKRLKQSGAGISSGVVIGAVIFILTGSVVWMALGIAFGAALEANNRSSAQGDDGERPGAD